MALSTAEIEAVVRDLKPSLDGGRIERMDQPERDKLVLYVRNGPALYWLLICTHPRFSRLHLLTTRPPRGRPASGFCHVLRQHVTSAPMQAIRQVPGDRVVIIEATAHDRLMRPYRVSLIAELFGVGSNLVLADESLRILAVNRRSDSGSRRLVPGAAYGFPEPPSAVTGKALLNRFTDAAETGDPLALSRAIQAHYARLEAVDLQESQRAELQKVLSAASKKARRRLRGLQRALEEARNAETIRRLGELLKIALPHVAPGTPHLLVDDVFEPDRPQVSIELNPALSPQENVEWLFRRYKKAKAGADRLREREEQACADVEALDGLLGRVAEADSEQALETLRQEATALRALPAQPRRPSRAGRAGPKGPRAFRSTDGLTILVARSQRENERLTLSIARGNDYWLHLADWPGPHVVVRAPDGEITQEALLDAAHLAVHFSKIRGAREADVVYAQCKNVRRLKGAGPGRVSYAQSKTLRVRLSAERLERLLKPSEAATDGDAS